MVEPAVGATFFFRGRHQADVTAQFARLHVTWWGVEVRLGSQGIVSLVRLLSRAGLSGQVLPGSNPVWSATWAELGRVFVADRSVVLVCQDGSGVRLVALRGGALGELTESLWRHAVDVELVEGTWWFATLPFLPVGRLRRRRSPRDVSAR
ncbi:MAG: hypothetical protein HGA44_17260 [Cellulomonadaceae bacterium]|nr:hypothetical protein [Cellulomonadaceae bacterium]